MKVVAGFGLFIVLAITWSMLFGIPGEYKELRLDLESAYAGAYGGGGGKALCKYHKAADRHWLGCKGGAVPSVGVWELVSVAGFPQALAANGKAVSALDRFPSGSGVFIRSGEAKLPNGVLSAFE